MLGLGHAPSPKELLRLDPAELAAQLMLYEYRLYVRVRPRECLLWAKKQEGEAVKHLMAFCATHSKLAAWVTSSVLDHDGIKKRAEMVDFWVKVAEVGILRTCAVEGLLTINVSSLVLFSRNAAL